MDCIPDRPILGDSAPGPQPFACETVPVAAAAADRAAWHELADRAAEPNPFFRPEFLLPAIAALQPKGIAVRRVWDRTGRLLGLAPVVRGSLGFGVFGASSSVWTHPYAPLGTPLIDRDAVDAAVAALLAPGSGGALAFPELSLDGPVGTALRRHAPVLGAVPVSLNVHRRALLESPLSAEAYRQTVLSPCRRRNERRFLRRLARHGVVTFTTATEPGAVASAFADFLRLEAAGWKGDRGTALACDARITTFAQEAIAGLAEIGGVRIDAYRIDGRPVGIVVSLVDGGDVFTWKMAHDMAFAAQSPGFLALLGLTEAVLDDVYVNRIDSLADAGHPIVDHIWHERRTIGTLLVPAGASRTRFRLAAAEADAYQRSRTLAKRLAGTVRDRLKRG
ncbi:GNAT family N-acetyltransferase [Rhodobium gokarnense]|uniref:CelD/BcsL family acetyltransferase involved in cellulose biosynthesis n=1 Tax=Rhodobium gokarnense TaxID=364296 RepID=A0ABT3HDT8_9HYPH|nr:GNAT family N-acetyltransferase [Rhodobium gokarnense]MCW2308560.1 CelD/BcsL family acetyltransferase involved in cellulose biosynthesis [Rhodobium gokarnense]